LILIGYDTAHFLPIFPQSFLSFTAYPHMMEHPL